MIPDLSSTCVEAAVPFPSTADIVLGDTLDTPDRRNLFRRRTTTAEVVSLRMRDVTLVPPLTLAFTGSEVVEPTRFSVFDHEVEAARKQVAASRRRRVEARRAFMGFNRPCTNSFHIITQIVPAIVSYLADPEFGDGTLLLPNLAPGSSDASQALTVRALGLAGLTTANVATLGAEPVDVEDLTVSGYLRAIDGPSAFCRTVFDRLAAQVAPHHGPRAIYVSRLDSKGRPMRNEHQLIARLLRFGIEPVVLSGLDLDAQVALFRNARLVIGPHGAGLANVVFCSPGAVLYELLPSHYVNPSVAHLAQMRQAHYWCDIHASDALPGVWRHQASWSADIGAVERRVAEIMARYDLAHDAAEVM